jgi:hypothetical protein
MPRWRLLTGVRRLPDDAGRRDQHSAAVLNVGETTRSAGVIMASSGLNRWPGLPPGRAPARSARAPPKAGANGRGGYRRGRWDRMPEPLTRTVLGGALGPAGRASRPLNLASQWLVTQYHRSQPAVAARRNRDRARSATCRALSGGPCAPVRSPCRPKPGLATAFKAAGAPSHGVGCCSPLRSAEADAITGQSVAVGHAGRHNYPPRRVGDLISYQIDRKERTAIVSKVERA